MSLADKVHDVEHWLKSDSRGDITGHFLKLDNVLYKLNLVGDSVLQTAFGRLIRHLRNIRMLNNFL